MLHQGTASKTLTVDNPRKLFEVDKMSESYHEIFDSQMPPEAAAQLYENSEAEEATEIGKKYLPSKSIKNNGGQFLEPELSVSFPWTWEETYAQPKNMEKSFN